MQHSLSETELRTYNALYEHLGARIMFNCDKVTYQGIIDAILPDIRTVKLRHTKIVDGDHYFGNLRFKFHEIISFKVVESAESVNRIPRNDYLLNILKNNQPVPSSTILKVLFDDKLSENESENDEPNEEKKPEKFVLDLPNHLQNKLPKDFVIIDIMCENFYEAIRCIAEEQLIGVSFHGPVISRFGKIIWICISTKVCSFLFDIQQLGKEAFEKGLKEIFESKAVKKVIHDCRFPSDCLAHVYDTHLSNVFDIRVADFYRSMQRYNEKYKFTSFGSLDFCLRIYLKVPQEFIYERETGHSRSNLDTFFSKRPISNEFLYDLLKSVMYLRLLYENLSAEMLGPLCRATNFYRTVLSRCGQKVFDFLGYDLSRPNEIPPCLIMNGIQTVCFQKPKKLGSLTCTFIHPQTGKVIASNETLASPTDGKISIDLKEERKNSLFKEPIVKESCETMNYKKSQLPNNVVSNVSSDQTVTEIKSDNLFSKPSFRHLDEVYHNLVHKKYMSGNSINPKPSVNNTFKFTDRKSLCSNADLVSSENMPGKNKSKFSSEGNCQLKEYSDESSEIWQKLRLEIMKEKASYPYDFDKDRKIHFLPG